MGAKREIDILFIGNGMTSYNNMPQILQKMLSGEKQIYNVTQSTYFNISLENHFSKLASQEGEGVRVYPLKQGEKSSTEELLLSKTWEYVVLQDYTLPSFTSENGVIQVIPIIQEIQKRHRTNVIEFVLFRVWPNLKPFPKTFSYIKAVKSLDEETDLINSTYDSVASATHLTNVPIANCFMNIMKYHKNINLYDGPYYPSIYGAYLNACVFYKHFTKRNASQIEYMADLDSTTVRTIQEVVDKIYP